MRIILITIASLAAACGSVQSPDNCCTTDAACAEIKSAVMIPCESGQVCAADHTCVAADCETSTDCDAASPICQLGVCVSTCAIDADCADVAGRTHCSPGGACVGCVDASHCSGDTAICDSDDNVCRGCERDNECASGVCIESDGTCAAEADILFVANGNDTGTCTKTAPCRSLGYAISKVPFGSSRSIIRIEGGIAASEPGTLTVTIPLTIDGTGTMVSKPATNAVPWMTINQGGQVVLGGLTIAGNQNESDPTIKVTNGSVRLGPGTTVKGVVSASGGATFVDRARIESSVVCSNGTLDIDRATFEQGRAGTTNCQATIRSSRFNRSSDGILAMTGGKAVIENNLFTNTFELSDSMYITSVSPGSVFRFNTVANLSGTDSDGVALACDGTLKVSSNIFAYRSQHPFAYGAGCHAEFSIFDDHTGTLPTPATDSMFVPFTSLFTDPVARDFTLSAASAARGAADPSITDVLIDIDGNGRPSGAADAGAFEAP